MLTGQMTVAGVSSPVGVRAPFRRFAGAASAALLYAALAVLLTWPLATRLCSAVAPDVGDPLLNVWILWWNAHALPWTAAWWNAPSFYPVAGALTFSEHLLGISALTSPLQWLGVSALGAYNTALILSFVFSALAAHFLVYTLTRSHAAGLIAGLAYGFNPYRMAQLSHLQMLWSWGIPLTLAALHRYMDSGRARWLLLFALAWLLQAAANGYYLLFVPVLLVLWVGWFVPLRERPGRLLAIAGAFALASLPLVPLLLEYQAAHAWFGLTRTLTEIRMFSADMTSLIVGSGWLRFWPAFPGLGVPEAQLFPGVTAVALTAGGALLAWRGRRPSAAFAGRVRWRLLVGVASAIALLVVASILVFGPWRISVLGLSLSARRCHKPLTLALLGVVVLAASSRTWRGGRSRRSSFMFYAAATPVMWLFSFGPEPTFAGVTMLYEAPYAWLLSIPGYEGVRVPARFAMLAVACLACAAGLGFSRLQQLLSPRGRAGFLTVAAAALVADTWCLPVPLHAPPGAPAPGMTGVQAAGVLELPLGPTDAATFAMARGEAHGLPVVNGYSGYDPPHYRVLRLALADREPGTLRVLAGRHPLAVVVNDADYLSYVEAEGATRVPAPGPTVFVVPGGEKHRALAGKRIRTRLDHVLSALLER